MGEDNSALTPRASPQTGLLPCPFCGSTEIEVNAYVEDDGTPTSAVACSECDCATPAFGDEEKAVAAWNRRNAHDDLVAALAELEAANEELCAGRSQDVYDVMIEDGQEGQLLALDRARAKARAALAKAGHAPDTRGEADPSSHP